MCLYADALMSGRLSTSARSSSLGKFIAGQDLKLEPQVIYFFPITDVKKLVRIIFRSNQSSKSNLAIYRAVARITLSISKSNRVICFWTLKRLVFPCDLAEICFTF